VYGIYPSEAVQKSLCLHPAMAWKTRIAYLKDLRPGDSVSYGRTFVARQPMRVATLPVGYADGLSRHLSNRGEVLVHGRRARICGVVCMDMTMIDVTHIPDTKSGDEAVLFGRQGKAVLPVEEMARTMQSIPYEVICNVGKRVPRQYLPAAGPLESTDDPE
jgi:alanine racemase